VIAVEEDRGVVALVDRMVIDAVKQGASDIHIEPNGADKSIVVRFRVDGDCYVWGELPGAMRSSLVSRIKIMAKLDISERRKPQDGKIRVRLAEKIIELRIATLTTVNGNEDVVMRVLASSKPQALDAMGFTERNLTELQRVLAKPYGLVLCVGPTGSGKTTTLHSALGSLNTPDTKIWTAEDPVEITQAGLRQLRVQPKIGLTFATALRAFLRADPDVIMVGEMRDEETASIAVEASLTGHLVLSTLHTNTAPETITRLLDMGLDPFSFGDALLGVLAQRLTRRLCPDCGRHTAGSRAAHGEMIAQCGGAEAWEKIGGPAFGPAFAIGVAVGCVGCAGTGYRGRLPLHELLVVTEDVKRAIARKASVQEIRALSVAGGMTTLLEDGILKCLAGRTDMRQVLSVASRA
jgi:type II secretory ATPase GspE/PulE/Tfp pilus assembly ATPase PilB-like protein